MAAYRSHKMKVTLMREQFRQGDVLDCERVMCGIGNDSMTMSIIVGRRQKIGHARKDRRSELDGVLRRIEIRNDRLAKIRREDERVLASVNHELTEASALPGNFIDVRRI